MFATTNVAIDTALFTLRVISPSLILLTTISLLTKRPSPPPSPSSITAVTVAARIPRRTLILTCLSFSSFIYLLDGLVFVVYAVINKHWPQHTGIEINALIGLVALAGLAALGSWKDVQGVDVWLLSRMKISVFLSLTLDVVQVILYGVLMPKDSTTSPRCNFFPSGLNPPLSQISLILIHFRMTFRPCSISPCRFCASFFSSYYFSPWPTPLLRTRMSRRPMMSSRIRPCRQHPFFLRHMLMNMSSTRAV